MLTASKLRAKIYGLLRRGRETGARVEFLRKRKVLKIVPETLTPKTRARKETKGL
jgi:hypothetical protein